MDGESGNLPDREFAALYHVCLYVYGADILVDHFKNYINMNALGFVLAIVSSLLIPGIITITKAKMSGRKGPGVFQPLFDVARLIRKGSVYSTTTSVIFQIGPVIYFASIVVALLFLPFGQYKGLLSFDADFVFFAYLLGIGKFMMIISAMDTGSGFEGMGANREALYSMLVEPIFFILMGSLALLTHYSSFYDLFVHIHYDSYNSGFDMGLINLATGLKFALYGGLIANFIFPVEWPLYAQIVLFIMVNLLFAVAVGLLESFRARNKLAKNPKWILVLSSISLIVFLCAIEITQKLL